MPENLACDSWRSFSDARRRLSILNAGRLVLQARNVRVTDKGRSQFSFAVCFAALNFEIENADAKARFALVNAAVARADHHAVAGFLFAAEINHRVRDRRVTIDRIGAGPEKKIARLQIIQFE